MKSGLCIRRRLLILINVFLFTQISIAQFPNPSNYNTATNANANGTISIGQPDLNWTASMTSSVGPYVAAVSCGNAFPSGWVASPFANTNWISYPHVCSGNPAEHSCLTGNQEIFYKLSVTLPSVSCGQSISTASAYCLSFDFYADNCIYQIFVNGVSNYLSSTTNPYFFTGFNASNKVTTSLCNNWVPGLNTVIVHVKSGGAGFPTWEALLAQANHTINTSIGQPLSSTVTSANPQCFGGVGSATVSAAGAFSAYSYTWLPSGGSASIASNLPAGTYTSIVTSSAQCSITRTFTITQPPATTLLTTPVSNSACVGSAISFTAQNSGGVPPYTYTWSGGPNSQVYNSNSFVAGNIIYSVSSRDANLCLSNRTVLATYVASPTLTALSTNVCFGAVGTLTVSGANSYTWLPSGFVGNTYTDTPTSSTIYTVVGATNGCTTGLNLSMQVVPALTLTTVSSLTSVCLGNTISYSANVSGGIPGYTYTWQPSNASNSVISIKETTVGTYINTITVSDLFDCSISKTLAVNFFNGLNLTATNPSVCPNTGTIITVSGGASYTWHPSGINGNTQTVSPLGPFSHSVIGESISGCTALATPSVYIKPGPTLSFTTYSITCGSLGSATVNATGGTGPFSYTWIPTFQNGALVSGLFPGTYTVQVLDVGTGCLYTPTVNFDPLIPLTGTVYPSGTNLCFGVPTGSASIVLSGGSNAQTYIWTSHTVQTTPTVSGLSAGINTVSVTDALTFCNVTHTFFIAQPPEFTVSIAASSPSVCLGSSITLTVNALGGTPNYTYTWGGGAVSDTLIVHQTQSGGYIYTVNIVDSNTCTVTETTSVLFVDNPTVSVSSASICLFDSAILTASGATSYSWNTGFLGNPLSVTPSVTSQYTVIGSSQNCTANATASIVVKTSPSPSITVNNPLCQNESLVFAASGGQSFFWNATSFTSTLQNPTIANVQPTNSGVYSLTVTAANSCTAEIAVTVTVNPVPLLSASGATVCEGSPLLLSANYVNGASYLWLGPSFSSTAQSPIVTTSASVGSKNYTVTITTAAGCISVGLVNASVVAVQSPTINAPSTACVGDVLSIQGMGGNNYTWFGPQNFYSTMQSPTIANISTSNSGTYSLTLLNGPCASTTTKSITVIPLPTPNAQSNRPVCERSAIQLLASAASGYTWTGPGGFTQQGQNVTIASASFSNVGSYTLSVRNMNFCIGKDTVFVNVLPSPNPTISNTSACFGGMVHLKALGGDSYSWAGPSNFKGSGSDILLSVLSASQTGVYTVTLKGQNGCTTTSTLLLTGFDFTLPVLTISGENKVCINSKTRLSASGGNSYEWRGPSLFQSFQNSIELNAQDISVSSIFTVIAKTQANCAVSKTIAVQVFPLPNASLSANKNNVCVPLCTTFQIVPSPDSAPILSGNFTIDEKNYSGFPLKYCFEKSGQFIVSAQFQDINNCINSSTLLINAYEKPRADFDFSPASPLAGIDQVYFYNSSSGAQQNNWTWIFEGHDSLKLTDKNPVYVFQNTGNFPVVLHVSNIYGCSDTIIKSILVNDAFDIYVPNTFSPNGDGVNDFFKPIGQGVIEYHMQIFNRWGQLIFETNDFYNGWNGTFNGKTCKVDSYIWKINAKDSKGKFRNLTGTINIIK